jgi:hypothetical protein
MYRISSSTDRVEQSSAGCRFTTRDLSEFAGTPLCAFISVIFRPEGRAGDAGAALIHSRLTPAERGGGRAVGAIVPVAAEQSGPISHPAFTVRQSHGPPVNGVCGGMSGIVVSNLGARQWAWYWRHAADDGEFKCPDGLNCQSRSRSKPLLDQTRSAVL